MNGVMNKMKWFIIAALSILVVGMTLFGIFGFNNTVDYRVSHEIQVSVDQNIDEAKTILKSSSEKFFSDNKISIVSSQIADEGATIYYKLNTDQTSKISALKTAIQTALDADTDTVGINAEAKISLTVKGGYLQTGSVLLALGIALVVIFLFVLIMEKLAGAVAVVASAAASTLIFVSLMAITRIPAVPFVEIMATFGGLLAAVLAISNVGRYKEEIKNSDTKYSVCDIVEKVAIKDAKRYLFVLIAVLVASVAVMVFFTPYMLVMGGQLAIAGISAIVCSYFITPLVWTAIKGRKEKKN